MYWLGSLALSIRSKAEEVNVHADRIKAHSNAVLGVALSSIYTLSSFTCQSPLSLIPPHHTSSTLGSFLLFLILTPQHHTLILISISYTLMPCGSLLIPCSAFGGLTPFSGAFATFPAVFWTLPVVLWRAPDAPFVVEFRVLVACLPVDFTMSIECELC